MSCDQAKDKIIDRVTGNIEEAERAALDGHLTVCAECRDELEEMEAVWTAMAGVDVRAKVHATPLVSHKTAPKWKVAGLIAAALIVGLFGGYATGVSRAPASPTQTRAGGGYLALLRQATPSFGADVPPESTLVREYGEWARELASNNQLIAAEQLSDRDIVFVAPSGAEDVRGRELAPYISGFFLLRADNFDHARRTIRTMPHLRYGGWIELRQTME